MCRVATHRVYLTRRRFRRSTGKVLAASLPFSSRPASCKNFHILLGSPVDRGVSSFGLRVNWEQPHTSVDSASRGGRRHYLLAGLIKRMLLFLTASSRRLGGYRLPYHCRQVYEGTTDGQQCCFCWVETSKTPDQQQVTASVLLAPGLRARRRRLGVTVWRFTQWEQVAICPAMQKGTMRGGQ